MSFWMPKSQYRFVFIRNLYIRLNVFGGSFSMFLQVSKSYDFLLQFTFQDAPKLILVTLALGLLGGLLAADFFVLFFCFHRFGGCPNHDDFLEEFVFQSAPKLVLVTPGAFRASLGGSVCSPVAA